MKIYVDLTMPQLVEKLSDTEAVDLYQLLHDRIIGPRRTADTAVTNAAVLRQDSQITPPPIPLLDERGDEAEVGETCDECGSPKSVGKPCEVCNP